ncbi:eukaryotic translation initiation factor 3 subunit I [Syncephalis plumigaleata]|nr:eukaryotic translation initiation factor 3 subunit I [Syncephalis plumigaleata]
MRPILLQGHTRALTQIKYNREGDLLFSVSKDHVVSVWFSHNGERLGTYHGHQGALWTVDSDSKTERLVTGSADNTARLWDIRTGRLLHTWEFPTAVKRVQFSEDDRYVLMVTERRMGHPGTITVMGIDSESETQSSEPVINIIPDGPKAMVGVWSYLNQYIISGHENGSIRQYDWKTGECINTVAAHEGSSDRTYFITSSKDKTARLIDATTLETIKVYSTDTPLNSAAITPTQDFVILGGGQDAMNVTTTSSRQGKFECRFYHKVFAIECGRVKGHFGPINTIAVHPDGKSFSSGGEDGYVRVHHFDPDYFRFKFEC